jgi:hypothetical protein
MAPALAAIVTSMRRAHTTLRAMDRLGELIEAQDLNGLLRAVDSACEARRWDELLDLADRCEEAADRGKQLWPIAAHIDYRLALEAPAPHAAQVLHPEVGRFAAGPLTEVAASTHAWAELAPHLQTPQVAAYVAQERVLRGEDLRGDARAHEDVLELPLVLQEWEPTYALATFKSTFVEVAEPWEPKAPLRSIEPRPGAVVEDAELTDALLDLVAPWISESNGAARAVVVDGDACAAASNLTLETLRLGRLTLDEAIQRMAWAAASGGAHGRRRGAALGRFMAWYTAALLTAWSWPVAPEDLGSALGRLRWFRWDEGSTEEGWALRLAVEDPSDGWAAALGASDVLEEVTAAT